MKILFYGGCHAAAMRRIVDQYAVNVQKAEHLTNFVLIRENRPFPYEQLKNFDLVIFNPILNKHDHNTSHLEEYCRDQGIRTLKYPWLQWEGYYPTIRKIGPSWYSGWWMTGLDEIADEAPDFQDFAGQVFEGTALHDQALQNLERTSGFLARLEATTDVKILGHVMDRFRDTRLFLTPDHASSELYKYILREIARLSGLRLDPAFWHSGQEIQAGIQIPVLPSVARALDLRFAGAGDFQNSLVLGSSTLSLTEYLKLHYYRRQVCFAVATGNTRLRDPDSGEAHSIREGTEVLGIAATAKVAQGYRRIEVLRSLRGDARRRFPLPLGRDMNFFARHWQMRTDAVVAADPEERNSLSHTAIVDRMVIPLREADEGG